MRCIVFDSGPIISFALNSMLWLIPKLRKKYGGEFYISSAIRHETIDLPSKSRRYAFESLNIRRLLKNGSLEEFDTEVFSEEMSIISGLANNIYYIGGKNLEILNKGELDSLVLAKNVNADALVVDERTTRLLLENPFRLQKFLENKFSSRIEINHDNLQEFERHFSTLKIIRSVELALVCVDLGFFNDLIELEKVEIVVEDILWALKLAGCSVSEIEIRKLVKLYRKTG